MSRLKVLGIALALAVAVILALGGGFQGLGAPAHQQTGAGSSGGSAQRAIGLVMVNLTEAASALAGVQPAPAVAAAGQAMPIPTMPPIEGPVTTAAVESPPAQAASAQYSSTNVQVEGIDEGDFVKTDGRWIYLCYGGVLYLITPGLKIEGWYAVGGGRCQLLAAEGRVLAIWSNGAATGLVLLSADGGLRPVARFQIEGRPLGARLEGSYAYVVASSPLTPLYLVNGTALGELPGVSPTPAGIVAVVAVDMSSGRFNYTALAAGDIYRVFMYGDRLYLFQRPDGLQMLADIVEAGRSRLPEGLWEELRGYIENGDYLGLYNALSRSRAASVLIGLSAPVNTTVYEIAVDGLSLGVAAVGEVPGLLTDQFAVAQRGGYLILAATEASAKAVPSPCFCPMFIRPPNSTIYVDGRPWGPVPSIGGCRCPYLHVAVEEGNVSLYVANADSLSVVAEVAGLAPGEEVHAGRLIGGIYYLVTYRAVDPLYAINVTDPARPQVLGFLKAPVFTDYLHPVGPGLLLGVAAGAGLPFFWGGEVQVLLYNVSNPAAPAVVSNVTVTNARSPVMLDYHAFLYRSDAGVAILPVYAPRPFVLVLSVEGGRLGVEAVVEGVYASRALYIGNVYYLVGPGWIGAYNSTFAEIGQLSLNS